MNVIDNLSTLLIDVEGQTVSRLINPAPTRDERRGSDHVSDEFAIGGPQIVHRRNVFFGDDEDVRGRARADVLECKNLIVFIYFRRRNIARNDVAKQTVGHGGYFNAFQME